MREITANAERRTEIAIVDTGIGIRTEDQAKLFQAFWRVENSAQREEGTGLGLYICERLAELIGGGISVASEYGKGSTFTLGLRDWNGQ